jgi:hypothetical protein
MIEACLYPTRPFLSGMRLQRSSPPLAYRKSSVNHQQIYRSWRQWDSVGVNDKPASREKPGNVADDADVNLTAEVTGIQKSETIGFKLDDPSPVALSNVQKSDTVAGNGETSATEIVSAIGKPEIAADTPSSASKTGAPSVKQTQTTATTISGASASAIASDGRRRPPELSKPRDVCRSSPDPICFTGGGRSTSQKIQDSDQATNCSMSDARKKP